MNEDEKSLTPCANDVYMNASRVSEQPLLPVLNISPKGQKFKNYNFTTYEERG